MQFCHHGTDVRIEDLEKEGEKEGEEEAYGWIRYYGFFGGTKHTITLLYICDICDRYQRYSMFVFVYLFFMRQRLNLLLYLFDVSLQKSRLHLMRPTQPDRGPAGQRERDKGSDKGGDKGREGGREKCVEVREDRSGYM